MRKPLPTVLASAVLLGAVCSLAVSPSPASASDADDSRRIVIVDGDEEVTITLDGMTLEVVSDGGSNVHVFDLETLGVLVEEALATALPAVEGALAGLGDLQVRVGASDDGTTALGARDMADLRRDVEMLREEIDALQAELEMHRAP